MFRLLFFVLFVLCVFESGVMASSSSTNANIYVRSAHGTSYSTIAGFNKLIITSGNGGLGMNNIYQYGSYLTCQGYRSCYQSNIKDVSNIYVTGYHALRRNNNNNNNNNNNHIIG